MPELPEVEITLRGIQPYTEQQQVTQVIVRHYALRWPIPYDIHKKLSKHTLRQLQRRGKYLLLLFDHGTAIIHLGMSGRLRVLQKAIPAQKHDHFEIHFANKTILRFTDPRRFGAFLWTTSDYHQHALLKDLGVEPLTTEFSARYLYQAIRTCKAAIKTVIMNHKIVTGIGNIYANEALFAAGIHPTIPANQLTLPVCKNLVTAIKTILRRAIKLGGTTLNDFLNTTGKPGYFANELLVYGRSGLGCIRCNTLLQEIRPGKRSTVYCSQCQAVEK